MSKIATSLALDWSEIFLLIFGLMVAVGVWGEQTKSKWKKWLRMFEVLVVVGVAGELIADGGIFVFSRHLQAISDTELAVAIKQAGSARISAGKAAMSADRANKLAGSVQSEVTAVEGKISKARSEIANLEPRHLTPEQISKMSTFLLTHRAWSFTISAATDVWDAPSFGRQIAEVFRTAGWDARQPSGIAIISRPFRGLLLAAGGSPSSRFGAAEIRSAFGEAGIEVPIKIEPSAVNPNRIELMIDER